MSLFGTKAETLDALVDHLERAKVLPQVRFTIADWEKDSEKCLEDILAKWNDVSLIVRSSAVAEDRETQSLAGHFSSVADVTGREQMRLAVEEVAASYHDHHCDNQVFVQPMLTHVVCSGVAFSKDPNTGAPYIIVSYDDTTGSTDSVTSGNSNQIKTAYIYKYRNQVFPNLYTAKIVQLVYELESIFQSNSLDIEFAITASQEVYLLQVRPLIAPPKTGMDNETLDEALISISTKVRELNKPHPYLYGDRTVFGNMPDWNPAEIIGVKPRPLALSLYKEIITDNIWAYQRDNYGYKNLRSFPLLISFHGLPYIDVRVSFNSFIPADVDESLSQRLSNYYIDRLIDYPSYHDKVEFEIIYSCYTLDLKERLAALHSAGFDKQDIDQLTHSLRKLTNRIIHNKEGLWRKDIEKISILEERREKILNSSLDQVSKVYWLLEDCKRYGTLPFAGLARAGFIAVQLLRSLVSVNVLNESEYEGFMNTLDTVSSTFKKDFGQLSKEQFLLKYGHLRPGTYDIVSRRYDEAPDIYFDWDKKLELQDRKASSFVLSLEQLRKIETMLREHELDHDILGLFEFIKSAIEGREYAKFIFTKSLSDAMKLFIEVVSDYGFTTEDASYADIECINKIYSSSLDAREIIGHSIEEGKERFRLTQMLNLPPLITGPEDVWAFHLPQFEPNYITQLSVEGPVTFVDEDKSRLKGNILFIPSADPGYDWIFSHDILGFVTMYGGVNSHMAIRAGELGIPAVIGAGEALFKKWSSSQYIQIDCMNRLVRVLR